ncbi:MAG: thioredoxin family protein [Planctomycetota bacterium]
MNPNSPSDQPSSSGERSTFRWLWQWFWRITLVVSIWSLWYCYYVPSNEIAWANSYASAQKQSQTTGKPIVLYFTGKWCVPCRIMKRNVWADSEVTKLVNDSYVPVMINVDDPDASETMRHFNVVGPPVVMVADSDGNVMRWRDGGIAKSDFLELLATSDESFE